MSTSGVLHIEGSQSRVDETLLAIEGSSNPFGDATSFLEGTCHLHDDDNIVVEGRPGKIGSEEVIFVTNAHESAAPVSATLVEGEALLPTSVARTLAGQARKLDATRIEASSGKPTKVSSPKTPPKSTKTPANAPRKKNVATKKKPAAEPTSPKGKR
jgi:hypothetical protein